MLMNKNAPIIVTVILLVSGLAYLITDKVLESNSREMLEQEAKKKAEEVVRLKEESAKLRKALKKEKTIPGEPPEKLARVFGKDKPGEEAYEIEEVKPMNEVLLESTENIDIDPVSECESINMKIVDFFSYLDEKEFIKEYRLTNGAHDHFKKISRKLYEKKPVAGEINFPEDILKNTYHLYRALNKRNIILIKDIIGKELDRVEEMLDYSFRQQVSCKDSENFLPPFGTLYEYSHFFLNTLGGRAYLFRLESRVRILLLYYSTIVIHEANQREINKYGIDIRPYIKNLEDDLTNYSKFRYSDKFLHQIEMIKKEYPVLAPVADLHTYP